jgi:hypothetical protein
VVFHQPLAFHSTTGVFNADAEGGHTPLGRLRRRRALPSTRGVLRLDNREARQEPSLQALLLRQAPAGWPGIACQLGPALSRGVPCPGGAQAAHVPGLVDHEEVVERVPRLLATVICLWRFGLGRAVDRTFGPSMPHRGGGAPARRVRLEPRSTLGGWAGRTPFWVCEGLMSHRRQDVNPFVRGRVPPPQELALHLVTGSLVPVGQKAEPRVRDRGPRTGVLGTIAATRAGLPSKRAVTPVGHHRLLERGQHTLPFGFWESGQRS